MKLHLGCGNRKFEGYLNIDVVKTRASDMICDCTKLPFEENSVDEIIGYHMLEHIVDREKAVANWYKILKPGGVCIMEVPNIGRLLKMYCRGDCKLDDILRPIYGQLKSFEYMHKWGYDKESLGSLFTRHGFSKIKLAPAQSPNHDKYGLRIEAIK